MVLPEQTDAPVQVLKGLAQTHLEEPQVTVFLKLRRASVWASALTPHITLKDREKSVTQALSPSEECKLLDDDEPLILTMLQARRVNKLMTAWTRRLN